LSTRSRLDKKLNGVYKTNQYFSERIMDERMLKPEAVRAPEDLRHTYNLLGYLWGGTSSLVNHPTRRNTKIMYISKGKEVPDDGFQGVNRWKVLGEFLGMISTSDDVTQLELVEELARNIQMPDGSLYPLLQFTPPDPATVKRENNMILTVVRSRIATLQNIGRIGMWLRNAGKAIGDL
jgi:hypothetical protein